MWYKPGTNTLLKNATEQRRQAENSYPFLCNTYLSAVHLRFYNNTIMRLPCLTLILFFSCFTASSQFSTESTEIKFAETRVDSIENKFDSVLLIGVGSSVTRLFLDVLSDNFSDSLKGRKISARYYYLGKNIKAAKKDFDTINKAGYKAILFFLPREESFYNAYSTMSQLTTNTRIGTLTLRIASSGISYKQNFNFQLYIPGTDMKKIWAASVEVSCDPSKSTPAKEVSKKLLLSFKNNKYIE